jgi:hypothetical protein
MKSIRNRMMAIAVLGMAAIGMNSTPAAAQANAFKGSFTLTEEVHWQGAVLRPGAYTFVMKSTTAPSQIVLTGPKGSIFVMAITASKKESGAPSELILEDRSEGRFVRELYLADIATHFRYYVPKRPKNEELLAKAPVKTEEVMVTMASR